MRAGAVLAGLMALVIGSGCAYDDAGDGEDATVASDGGQAALDDVPRFSPDPPGVPSWIAARRSRFWEAFGADHAASAPPFGRVRADLTSAPSPYRVELTREPEERLYLRAEWGEGGVTLRPHCSVLSPSSHFVDDPAARGPWAVRRGSFSPGERVELTRSDGQLLVLHVEEWWQPGPPPLYAWSSWVYTRTLVVEHGSYHGLRLAVGAASACDTWAQAPLVAEACRHGNGSPLSPFLDPWAPPADESDLSGLLDPLRGGRFVPSTPEELLHKRLLDPIGIGSWMGFCGRSSFSWFVDDRVDIDDAVRSWARRLGTQGVDLVRYLVGSVLTFDGLFYPQVETALLARLVGALGLTAAVSPELERLAADPELDWPNRFRAVDLLARLRGSAADLEDLRRFVPVGFAPDGFPDLVDEECMAALVGSWSLGCEAG